MVSPHDRRRWNERTIFDDESRRGARGGLCVVLTACRGRSVGARVGASVCESEGEKSVAGRRWRVLMLGRGGSGKGDGKYSTGGSAVPGRGLGVGGGRSSSFVRDGVKSPRAHAHSPCLHSWLSQSRVRVVAWGGGRGSTNASARCSSFVCRSSCPLLPLCCGCLYTEGRRRANTDRGRPHRLFSCSFSPRIPLAFRLDFYLFFGSKN